MTGHEQQYKFFDGDASGAVAREEAPAKINLRLKVVGRRSDGHHLLDMINTTATLADTVTVLARPGKGVTLRIEGTPGIAAMTPVQPEENLAARAAERFIATFGVQSAVWISLVKRIPVGGGLGGASTDAAAVLRALASLFQEGGGGKGESERRLYEIALSLGADVPYLLRRGLCRVGGIGEVLAPVTIDGVRGRECLLVFPPVAVPTPAIFQRLREAHPVLPVTPVPDTSCLEKLSLSELVENDLEAYAIQYAPVIGFLLQALRSVPGAIAGMTGSGSTIFVFSAADMALPEAFLAEVTAKVAGVEGSGIARVSLNAA